MTFGARLSFVTFCFVATISSFGATWYASPNGAVDAECTAEAPGTIQAAIDKAVNAKSWDAGDTVILLPGIYDYSEELGTTASGITGNSCIIITKGYLTIKSSTDDPSSVILVGRGGETYISEDLLTTNTPQSVRAFAANTYARIESLTISNFYATIDGVAMWSKNNNQLIAYNCRIVKNQAAGGCGPLCRTGADSSYFLSNTNSTTAGAMYDGFATNCVFVGNTGVNGGAINRTFDIHKCIFVDNKATKSGGAINCNTYVGFNVSHCVFSNNWSASDGGAVTFQQYPSRPNRVSNCLFFGNVSQGSAGAVKHGAAYDSTFINNSSYGGYGGGAMNSTGNNFANIVSNCVFIGNYCSSGGAVKDCGLIMDSVFVGNSAKDGGAVVASRPVRCYFTNNIATASGGAWWQGRYGSYIACTNCVFYGNQAASGGAICYSLAYNCIFENNISTGHGGAIYSEYESHETIISNCVIVGNYAKGSGGGVVNGTYIDCVITNNRAEGSGGGGHSGRYYNSKIINNKAKNGGGVYKGKGYGSLFANNYASASGGGAGGDTRTRTSISNCVFSANSATNMAGADASVLLYNCFFDGNETLGENYNLVGFNAVNCTFVNNRTINRAMTASVTTNCLFNGNLPYDIGGGKHQNSLYETTTGSPTLTDCKQSSRPLFNEGRDPRAHWYMPRAKSPARDGGVDHFYTDKCLDADGRKRLNGTVDIGCFEFWAGSIATHLMVY